MYLGRIVEQGPHEQLFEAGGDYRDLHARFVRLSRGESAESVESDAPSREE